MKKRAFTRNMLLAGLIIIMVSASTVWAAAATRKADVSKPSSGNMFMYFEGNFDTSECRKALDRINEIRKEACREGVINPSTGKPLTDGDYRPIKWSSDLERIAQMRAAEATVVLAHTRPNGTSCFTVSYNGTQSWGEVLAWNYSGMVYGVNQWYGEKEDWVQRNANAVTGHYTQMIDPNHTYVGLGSFRLSSGGWTCISGEFSYSSSMMEKLVGVSGKYRQAIEVPKKQVKASLPSCKMKKGQTRKLNPVLKFNGTHKGSAYGSVAWKSSKPSVASVSKKGVVTAKRKGKTTVTATFSGKKASCTVTVN